jgi:phospholipid/cholesterol/gamma-HCH transport system substrate-binding protein
MAEWTNAAKVGAMTILLSGALYGGWQFISRTAGTADGYTVWATLDDVTGVAPRSRVMISGVQVGVVDKISLDPQTGKARVDVRMKPEFPLFDDAAIGKKATSLIGEYYIVLTPGTQGKETLNDGDRVKFKLQQADLDTIQTQIYEILEDVKGVTESLEKTVGSDRGQQQIDRILENLAQTMEQLNGAIQENRANLRETIANANAITRDTRPELVAILQNIKESTSDIKELTTEGQRPGERSGEIRETAERINRASESLESLMKHADNVASRIDRGEGTVGRLTKDETLINEVEEVVEGVSSLIGGIGRVQTIVGLRADYNFLANTIKSYVELRLQPSEDKYYMIQLVNDPRGLTTIDQIDVNTTNPNDPQFYREIRTTTTNSFRFSFQFAKKMGPFTGRFGILESTGGIGIDTHLLDDRFEIEQDLFGFGEQITPRWRVSLSYEFVRKLWLLGGIDNILSDDRRDYFFGLELRFNDEDLKSILPFAPTPSP